MKPLIITYNTQVDSSTFFATFKQKSIKYYDDLIKKGSNASIPKSKISKSVFYISFAGVKGRCLSSIGMVPASIGIIPELSDSIPEFSGIMTSSIGIMPSTNGMPNIITGMKSALTTTMPASMGKQNIATDMSPSTTTTMPASIVTMPARWGITSLNPVMINLDSGTINLDSGKLPNQIELLSNLRSIIQQEKGGINE